MASDKNSESNSSDCSSSFLLRRLNAVNVPSPLKQKYHVYSGLTLYQMTNFGWNQIESICRRQIKSC